MVLIRGAALDAMWQETAWESDREQGQCSFCQQNDWRKYLL